MIAKISVRNVFFVAIRIGFLPRKKQKALFPLQWSRMHEKRAATKLQQPSVWFSDQSESLNGEEIQQSNDGQDVLDRLGDVLEDKLALFLHDLVGVEKGTHSC